MGSVGNFWQVHLGNRPDVARAASCLHLELSRGCGWQAHSSCCCDSDFVGLSNSWAMSSADTSCCAHACTYAAMLRLVRSFLRASHAAVRRPPGYQSIQALHNIDKHIKVLVENLGVRRYVGTPCATCRCQRLKCCCNSSSSSSDLTSRSCSYFLIATNYIRTVVCLRILQISEFAWHRKLHQVLLRSNGNGVGRQARLQFREPNCVYMVLGAPHVHIHREVCAGPGRAHC